MKKCLNIILLLIVALGFTSCKKFLEEPPNEINNQEKLATYEEILKSPDITNSYPYQMLYMSDEVRADFTEANNSPTANAYFWRSQLNKDTDSIPVIWGQCYRSIHKANMIINNVMNVEDGTEAKKKALLGEALTLRAVYYFDLLTVYAKAYDQKTAATDPGVPLLTTENLTEIYPQRSSVQEAFDAIIYELKAAETLLPTTAEDHSRINKYSAFGILARIYLYMQNYDQAMIYANKALAAPHQVLDYNDYVNAGALEIPQYNINPEVLWHRLPDKSNAIWSIYYDDVLASRFRYDDLRFIIFSVDDGYYHWNYYPPGNGTFGMTFPELYLIKAEVLARHQKIDEALEVLNALRVKRISKGSYKPLKESIYFGALYLILKERYLELPFKGVRWADMKRLDAIGEMQEVNHYKFWSNAIVATLLPKSPKYTFEIPSRVLMFNPNMTKNFR